MIGFGALPAATSLNPSRYTGWIVPSANAATPDKYYRLVSHNNVLVWLDQSSRIVFGDDPVMIGSNIVVEMHELSGIATSLMWNGNEW